MVIIFDKLNVETDGSAINIKCHIDNKSYYSNLYISTLSISTQESNPTEDSPGTLIYNTTIPNSNLKELNITLSKNDLLVSKSLDEYVFFIYVTVTGTFGSDVPCGQDARVTLGITYNKYPMYKQLMTFVKELGNTCSVPTEFIDDYLKYKALQLSVATSNIPLIIDYFNGWYRSKPIDNHTVKCCKCHG